MAALAVIGLVVLLWVTAPQWEVTVGLTHPTPAPGTYIYLNITSWKFSGPSECWQGTPFSHGGTISPNGLFGASIALPYPGGASGPTCTAKTVQVLTAGFEIQNSNVPLSVEPGGQARLFVNLTVPGFPYNGALNLSVDVTSP